jgi:hypothetical protein
MVETIDVYEDGKRRKYSVDYYTNVLKRKIPKSSRRYRDPLARQETEQGVNITALQQTPPPLKVTVEETYVKTTPQGKEKDIGKRVILSPSSSSALDYLKQGQKVPINIFAENVSKGASYVTNFTPGYVVGEATGKGTAYVMTKTPVPTEVKSLYLASRFSEPYVPVSKEFAEQRQRAIDNNKFTLGEVEASSGRSYFFPVTIQEARAELQRQETQKVIYESQQRAIDKIKKEVLSAPENKKYEIQQQGLQKLRDRGIEVTERPEQGLVDLNIPGFQNQTFFTYQVKKAKETPSLTDDFEAYSRQADTALVQGYLTGKAFGAVSKGVGLSEASGATKATLTGVGGTLYALETGKRYSQYKLEGSPNALGQTATVTSGELLGFGLSVGTDYASSQLKKEISLLPKTRYEYGVEVSNKGVTKSIIKGKEYSQLQGVEGNIQRQVVDKFPFIKQPNELSFVAKSTTVSSPLTPTAGLFSSRTNVKTSLGEIFTFKTKEAGAYEFTNNILKTSSVSQLKGTENYFNLFGVSESKKITGSKLLDVYGTKSSSYSEDVFGGTPIRSTGKTIGFKIKDFVPNLFKDKSGSVLTQINKPETSFKSFDGVISAPSPSIVFDLSSNIVPATTSLFKIPVSLNLKGGESKPVIRNVEVLFKPLVEQSFSVPETTTHFKTGSKQGSRSLSKQINEPLTVEQPISDVPINSIFTNPSITPPPTFAGRGFFFEPFIPGGGGGAGLDFGTARKKQPKGYTPSLTALVFNVRGKRSGIGEFSGLGLRPIPTDIDLGTLGGIGNLGSFDVLGSKPKSKSKKKRRKR